MQYNELSWLLKIITLFFITSIVNYIFNNLSNTFLYSIFEFEDALMDKLFSKREPTNELKFILKKRLNFTRVDKEKPMYLDDLKRMQKLKEMGQRK